MKTKLTIRSIDAFQPTAKDKIVWDSELPGFGLKITPTGRKTFFLYYRTKDGRQRRPTIERYGAIKPEKAREIAKEWLAIVAMGGDPSATRTANREAPTVTEVCQRYLAEHAATRKRASSQAEDKRLIDKRILPALGKIKIGAVKRSDIVQLHHTLADKPYEANRTLALLSKLFSLSEQWALRPANSNPARNIDKYRERKRERFLSNDELSRLAAAIDAEEDEQASTREATTAIRLLVLTGCRLSEILELRWREVDLDKQLLLLPDSKTGAKPVYLSAAAAKLLREWRDERPDAEYVCPGRRKGQHMVNLQKPWRRIRERANLRDVRLHDLRHTYASFGAGAGLSLPMIGKLLGHGHTATTQRYAHLADDPVRRSAEIIGSQLAGAFAPALVKAAE